MVLEADYEGLDKVQQVWSIIPPPQESIELLFPKVNGLTLAEVIEELRKVGAALAGACGCSMFPNNFQDGRCVAHMADISSQTIFRMDVVWHIWQTSA
jgi:hypothetical protein